MTKIKELIVRFIELLFWRSICVVYRRLYSYNKWMKYKDFVDAEVVETYNHWLVIKNKYPYPRTKNHLLLIPKRLIYSIAELSEVEKQEMLEIIHFYQMNWYLVLWRGYVHPEASVSKLHIHFIS